MIHASGLGADGIRLERIYEAPIEDVWSLWTTKEGIEDWFGPEGMRVEVLALELWVGGAFDHVMTAVGAEQVDYFANLNRSTSVRVNGRFAEIVHHRRLEISFDIDFVPGVEPYPYMMAVDLYAEASG